MIIFTVGSISQPFIAHHLRSLVAEDNRLIHLHSNSMVILYDNDNPGFLRVTEDTGHPGDFDHEIILYRVNSECSDLQIREETYDVRGTDLSLINGTTTYALAGSSMTYNICGSANSTYQTERLELVLLYGLEALQSPSRDHDKFYYFHHGTDGEWTCKKVTYNIEDDGYYTPIFLTAPQEANFIFTTTFRYQFIKSLSLPFYKLKMDKDYVQFFLTQHQCVVASIHENPKILSPYVHVQIFYKYYIYPRQHPVILLFLAINIITIIIGVLLFICPVFFCCLAFCYNICNKS